MSKRDLKKYLAELDKSQLEEQIMDLYQRFKSVKEYYDFAFKPNERKLIEDCKFKIYKEYFPPRGRRPKTRRSIAKKCIKHFMQLGVAPEYTAELMLFNLETAQSYSARRKVYDSFYPAMFRFYEELIRYCISHGMQEAFAERINAVAEEAWQQDWINKTAFEDLRL
jgi:hypothetical protein